MGIEAELGKEFAEYLAEIKKHIEEIKEASLKFHAGKLLTAKVVYKELEDHWLNILRVKTDPWAPLGKDRVLMRPPWRRIAKT